VNTLESKRENKWYRERERERRALNYPWPVNEKLISLRHTERTALTKLACDGEWMENRI
jgi:hypothetical protein